MCLCNYTGQMIDENKTDMRKGSFYVIIKDFYNW
jgi:hypothetical protein